MIAVSANENQLMKLKLNVYLVILELTLTFRFSPYCSLYCNCRGLREGVGVVGLFDRIGLTPSSNELFYIRTSFNN